MSNRHFKLNVSKIKFLISFSLPGSLGFPLPNECYFHPSGPKSLSHLWCLFVTPNISADPLGPLLNITKDCLFLVSTTILFHLYYCINLLPSIPLPTLAPLEFILITRQSDTLETETNDALPMIKPSSVFLFHSLLHGL